MPGISRTLINDGASGESYIWANILKTADFVGPLTNHTYPFPAYLDSNGYPNNAPGNILGENLQYIFSIPTEWGTTPLAVGWQGTGAFYLQSADVTNFNITGSHVDLSSIPTFIKVTGTDVRITFNFTTAPIDGLDNYITYFMTGTTYNNMRNLYFCRQSDETAVLTNPNALNPDYISRLQTLNPKIFRGLDISGVNTGNQSQFSQRAPAGAFSFFAERYPPECWAGSASGTDTYTCATPSGWTGLIDGATVQVQFTNANTLTGTSVTLNVGGTGAHRVTDLGPNDINFAGEIAAGSIWTLTYSSVYGYWTGYNQVGSNNIGGIVSRAPLEQHIAIANAINCDCWYNISHRMSPADGTAITNTVLANLNPNLAFYPELSNEIWNLKTATTYVFNLGFLMGLGTTFGSGGYSAYGLLARRMMGAITSAWGGPNSRLRRVISVQAYSDSSVGGGNDIWRFKGQLLAPSGTGQGGLGQGNSIYNAFTGSADYTTKPNRPIDFSDSISYATYYGGGQLLQFDSSYGSPLSYAPSIQSISKANPGVLTYTSDPGFLDGTRLAFGASSIVGMTQLNNTNVTVHRITPTTYSMFSDAAMATSVDTTSFSTFISGSGTIFNYIGGLVTWAAQYKAGGASIQTAFNNLDADIRSGSQYDGGNGIFRQLNTQTLIDLSTNIYPGWNTLAASHSSNRPSGLLPLTIDCYEGGMGGNIISTASCTAQGLPASFATDLQNLLFNYKKDSRFYQLVLDQFNQFTASSPTGSTPGWFQIVGYGGPWALTPFDIYSIPTGAYQSWLATVFFNGQGTAPLPPDNTQGGGNGAKWKWAKEKEIHRAMYAADIKRAAAVLSKMGGHARAASLTSKERSRIASKAAKARWK